MTEKCAGDSMLVDGKCTDFTCLDSSSCNYKGECSSDNKACVCEEYYDGIDCSIFLEGENHKLMRTYSFQKWIS